VCGPIYFVQKIKLFFCTNTTALDLLLKKGLAYALSLIIFFILKDKWHIVYSLFYFKKRGASDAYPTTLELGYRRVAKNQGNDILCSKLWFSTLFLFPKYHRDLDKSINALNNLKLNVNKKKILELISIILDDENVMNTSTKLLSLDRIY